MVRSLNTRSLLKPENRVENGEDLKALTESERKKEKAKAALSGVRGDIQQVSLRLYFLKNGGLAEDVRPFLVRPQEDNIRDAVQTLLTMSGIEVSSSGAPIDLTVPWQLPRT